MKLTTTLAALATLTFIPTLHAAPAGVPMPRAPTTGLVQLAQAGDQRVIQLEEQVRQLNGLVEELNFQILQMQEQLRKMQEDNEFRFQELEGKRTDGAGASPRQQDTASATPSPSVAAPSAPAMSDPARRDQVEEVIETPNGTLTAPPPAVAQDQSTSPRLGEPPRTFGQIVFDSQGNVVGARPGDPAAPAAQPGTLPGVQTGPGRPAPDNTTVAALPQTESADTLYRDAYQFVMSGDYAAAEAGFRKLIEAHPSDARAADAQFWLGESLLGQGKNREAAQTFLAANREHPNAPKAAETMLKLGVSLAAMNQKDVACATFAEVARRYPSASPAVLDRAKQERGKASC